EALLELGWTLLEGSDHVGARAALREAHELAWGEGLDEIATDAATVQAFVSVFHFDDPGGATEWLRRAEVALDRLPPVERASRQGLLRSVRGHVFGSLGRIDEARREFELALSIAEEGEAPEDLLIEKLTDLGAALGPQDPEAALALYARA